MKEILNKPACRLCFISKFHKSNFEKVLSCRVKNIVLKNICWVFELDYSPRCVRLLLCGGDVAGQQQEEREEVGLRAERVDSSPVVEHNSLTQKIKQKSRKIVMDAEKGEFY